MDPTEDCRNPPSVGVMWRGLMPVGSWREARDEVRRQSQGRREEVGKVVEKGGGKGKEEREGKRIS